MLIRVFIVFLANFLFLHSFSQSSSPVNIIPKPVSLKIKKGTFKLDRNTTIVVKDQADKDAADFFNSYLQNFYGFSLDITDDDDNNYIILATRRFVKAPDNPEHYSLEGTGNMLVVEGDSYEGTFRGVQSLIQLLPVKKSNSLQLPLVSISDQPGLRYRGLMLDVARHFFDVEFVKKYIDFIALHKMNTFHWHLTDDQGWRIEIKKYPELTEKGAYRNGTIIGRYPGTGNDNKRYGGFYTQEQIKEVVEYASKRHITVIPEIEMPGHAKAALASFSYLGCTGGPYEVKQTWGVEEDVFCAGNDSVFTFLQNVLDEVITLFPSQYVHIGGDECPKGRWKACPKCQKRIKDNNLKSEHELQSYFIQTIEEYVNSKGRKIIGWDEILEGGLAPNATVMSWRGEAGGIEAAKQDHDVIMTPGTHVYLDHSQSKKEDSVTIGGYLSIQKVYSYEPVPRVLNENEKKHVLGAQGNVWTEYMNNSRKVEYMLFPRLSALSEVLWSPVASRSWNEFEKRLAVQFRRYDLWKVNYSRALFTDMRVKVDPKKKIASK
jgi:hexosaminidase